MKKMIIICVGNTILFLLLGLALLFPFSEIQPIETAGFIGTITIYPVLLIVYLIIYPVIYYIIGRLLKWKKNDCSELSFSDEREKTIVAEATKTSYLILIGGLIVSMVVIAGLKLFSLFVHENFNIYFIGILLMTILLVLSSVSYCIKWCVEYHK